MNKKEQKIFIEDALENIKENGITIGHFLEKIGMSRTNLFFIRKGERELLPEKKEAIITFMKERLIYETD